MNQFSEEYSNNSAPSRYEKKPAVAEDEAGLGIPESDLLRRGEKVRILHHQARDFTTEARFSEKDFEVSLVSSFQQFRTYLLECTYVCIDMNCKSVSNRFCL